MYEVEVIRGKDERKQEIEEEVYMLWVILEGEEGQA